MSNNILDYLKSKTTMKPLNDHRRNRNSRLNRMSQLSGTLRIWTMVVSQISEPLSQCLVLPNMLNAIHFLYKISHLIKTLTYKVHVHKHHLQLMIQTFNKKWMLSSSLLTNCCIMRQGMKLSLRSIHSHIVLFKSHISTFLSILQCLRHIKT